MASDWLYGHFGPRTLRPQDTSAPIFGAEVPRTLRQRYRNVSRHFGTVCATVFSTRFHTEGRRTETGAAGICTHVTASSQRLHACPSRSDGRHAAATSRASGRVLTSSRPCVRQSVRCCLASITEAAPSTFACRRCGAVSRALGCRQRTCPTTPSMASVGRLWRCHFCRRM